MFPVDSMTLGILCGESYNGLCALADLFVTLKYPTISPILIFVLALLFKTDKKAYKILPV